MLERVMMGISRKVAIKTTLAVVIVTATFIILAVLVIGRRKPCHMDYVIEDLQPQVPVVNGVNWPMFRGGQNLSGRADGALPDSMALIWKFKTGGEVKSSPSISEGLVFVGSTDANIYAIDLEKGHQIWAYKTDDAVEASPCVVGGVVYVGSLDGWLYALDAKSGQLKWKYQTEGKIMGGANWTLVARPSWPCLHSTGRLTAGLSTGSLSGEARATGLWILVGSYDNKLHCVDSASGKVVWTYETGSFINGSPAVGDGKAVFGGCDAKIYVVSVADGNMVTQIDSGSYIAGSAAIIEGRVYVGNYDNVFLCGEVATGAVVWKYTGGTAPIFSSPAVGEDVVVFGCRDKRVHCVNKDSGKMVWTFTTSGEVDSSPTICRDKVVVGSGDGRLYMLRLSDGKQVWSYEIGQPIISSPAVARGVVVVGSDDGYVYAFGPRRQKRVSNL